MLEIIASLAEWMTPEIILKNGGFWILLLIVFLETGVFFGVFLPGDSLLLTAGILCDSYLNVTIYELVAGLTAAGFLGSVAGYVFGKRMGVYLLTRKESVFFKRQYLVTAEDFYRKYGQAAFVIGRFLPIARTFVPILAGLVRAQWWSFVGFNLLGALLWVMVFVAGGYWLSNLFPAIIEHLELIILLLVCITSTPLVLTWLRQKRKTTKQLQR